MGQQLIFKDFSMRRITASILAATVAFTSVAANAAVITAQGGQVYVNTGDGFSRIAGPVQATSGARVLLRGGGLAIISYENGCVVRLGGSRVWNIAPKAPCAPGQQVLDLTQTASYVGNKPRQWQTSVDPAQAPSRIVRVRPEIPASSGTSSTALIVGGLVAVAGVGIAVALGGGSKKSSPASP